MENKKLKMSNKRFRAILIPAMALVLVLAIVVSFGMNAYAQIIDKYLGKGTIHTVHVDGSENWDSEYYASEYNTAELATKHANEVTEQLCEEGFVLLKNDGSLPLTGSSVSLLGRGSVDPIYGGNGSGSVSSENAVKPYEALKNAGFDVDEGSYRFFSDNYGNYPRASIAMDSYDKTTFLIGEIPAETYTFAVRGDDTAIIIFSRNGGEGWDLSTDLYRDKDNEAMKALYESDKNARAEMDHYVKGQHQLELTVEEKSVVAYAKEHYAKVIVVSNSPVPMELGDLNDDPEINGIIWVGYTGTSGMNALGKILNGTVNPSGHLSDTYAADFTKDPTFQNLGGYLYEGIESGYALAAYAMNHSVTEDATAVFGLQYEEGIYVGYKYYETAAAEAQANNYPGFDYDQAVVYPFGYGLSYTTFKQEWNKTPVYSDGIFTFEIKVTNTGDSAGKCAVDLYVEAPYMRGGIEKAKVLLSGYAKTKLLEAGESDVVTITVAAEDIASYDYKTERCYVLDEGEYVFYTDAGKYGSHCWANTADTDNVLQYTHKLNKVVYNENNKRESDATAAINLFDDVSAIFKDTLTEGYALGMSRSDFAGTFPTAPTNADAQADKIVLLNGKTIKDGLKPYENVNDPKDEQPETGLNAGLTLSAMRGIDYDDPAWDVFLDQLTEVDYQESDWYINNSMYTSKELETLGIPGAVHSDGPSGFSNFLRDDGRNNAYCSEIVIACSRSHELQREMGRCLGLEARYTNNTIVCWYGPGLDIHRSPFGGRNFEYYSEDAVLAGKAVANVVSGAGDMGVVSMTKHFVMNDQEAYRKSNICTWATEQTMRETYFKAYEIMVKEAKTTLKYIADENGTMAEKEMPAATGLMSSFNYLGTVWAGGSKALMTDVLRGEWNFRGVVITDANAFVYMVPDQGMRAGSDLDMTLSCGMPGLDFSLQEKFRDTSSATARIAIRNAIKNMAYAYANSLAMNHTAPGDIVEYTLSPWRIGLIIGDTVAACLILGGVVWIVVRTQDEKKHPGNYKKAETI